MAHNLEEKKNKPINVRYRSPLEFEHCFSKTKQTHWVRFFPCFIFFLRRWKHNKNNKIDRKNQIHLITRRTRQQFRSNDNSQSTFNHCQRFSKQDQTLNIAQKDFDRSIVMVIHSKFKIGFPF